MYKLFFECFPTQTPFTRYRIRTVTNQIEYFQDEFGFYIYD